MSIRCGCTAEGDEIVFGPAHQCSVTQPARADHVFELQDDDMRQRPYETEPADILGALAGAIDRARKARREDPTLSPPEPRYMETLDESERRGD